jgi:hypothetical protein
MIKWGKTDAFLVARARNLWLEAPFAHAWEQIELSRRPMAHAAVFLAMSSLRKASRCQWKTVPWTASLRCFLCAHLMKFEDQMVTAKDQVTVQTSVGMQEALCLQA